MIVENWSGRRRWLWRAGLLAVFGTFVAVACELTEHVSPESDVYDYLVGKAMETPVKWCLNGYLGQFLRMKMLGNLVWLSAIAAGSFLVDRRTRSRADVATAATIAIVALIIAVKGNINFRYQATLQGCFIVSGLVAVRRLWLARDPRGRGAEFALFIAILGAVWVGFARERGQFTGLPSLASYVPGAILERTSVRVGDARNLLIANESAFYYLTDRFGLYYSEVGQSIRTGVAFAIFTPTGVDRCITQGPPAEAVRHLRERLGLRYILTSDGLVMFDAPLRRFLSVAGRVIDYESPFRLYELVTPARDWLGPDAGARVVASGGFSAAPESADRVLTSLTSPGHSARQQHPLVNPSWLEIDLGAERTIDQLEVAFYNQDYRATEYAWQARAGNGPWQTIAARAANDKVFDRLELEHPLRARALRFEIRGWPHPWGSIVRSLHAYEGRAQ